MSFDNLLKANFLRAGNALASVVPLWYNTKEQESMLEAVPGFSPTLPVNIATIPEKNATHFYEFISFPKRYIFTLRQVYVSYYGVVFRNLRIFRPSLVEPDMPNQVRNSLDMEQSLFLSHQWSKHVIAPPADVVQPIALTYELWSAINYYHWVCDTLPRLLLLREKYPNCTLLVPHPTPSYITETTRRLGFNTLLGISRGQVLKVKTLVLPELTARGGMQNPYLIKQVRNELLYSIGPGSMAGTKRIYASRARAGMRKLVNEQETVQMLHQYGFEMVHFEDYTFTEQLDLMRKCTILVGVHGANLTNLLFMPEQGHVIELMNHNRENLCYYHLASNVNIKYSCIVCATEQGEGPSKNDDNLVVDISVLEAEIQAYLQ